MKKLNNQKGITLVALVVTIIVLLILAGVSLSLVAGGNGILKRASSAADETNIATAKEQVVLKLYEYTTEYYEAVYVDKTVSINVAMGDWIACVYGGDDNKMATDNGEYEFTIAATATSATSTNTTPLENLTPTSYKITIYENNKISADITGKLASDGTLTWDDEATS